MPAWMHERAEHILAKNPSMPKSEAFAIASQQMHAVGKGPKNYGTAEGKETAKEKYKTPGDDQKRSNPGGLKSPKMEKKSMDQVTHAAFLDELTKIAEDAKKKHPKPGIAKTIGVSWIPGVGIPGAFGMHKGAPHGEQLGGAVRGGLGFLGGSTLGQLAGAGIGRAAGQALGDPGLGQIAGATLGGIGGGIGGYKVLTRKYNEKP